MDFKLVNRLLGKLTLAFCAVLVIPLLGALLKDHTCGCNGCGPAACVDFCLQLDWFIDGCVYPKYIF